MLDRIKALFGDRDDAASVAPAHDSDQLRLAAVALLVEAACLDDHFDDAERDCITALVRQRFELGEAEAAALLSEAEKATDQASELYRFTRVVKDSFTNEERIELVEMLWGVVYADGVLHDYEASLLRRVAGLIYVNDRDSGDARKRVLEGLGRG